MRYTKHEQVELRIDQEILRCNHHHCVKLCDLYLKRVGEFERRVHLPKRVNIEQMARNEIRNRLLSYGEGYDVLKDIL
jgi:hypothetical protein